MIYTKRNFIISIFFVIIIQILLYSNNSQNTKFRFFVWTIQEIKIGKLISISFFSGLLTSTFLNNLINIKTVDKVKKDYIDEDKMEDIQKDEYDKSNFEIPPERDVRDTQPTISVNYRVIKSSGNNEIENDENYSNKTENQNDWLKDNSEW